jgi:hypothetical protein
MGGIFIGPLLQEKIRKESTWFPGKTAILMHYIDCYYYDGDKKHSLGPGFTLYFKDRTSLMKDSTDLTVYVEVVLEIGIVCILRITRDFLPEDIRLEVVDDRISIFTSNSWIYRWTTTVIKDGDLSAMA